MRPASQEVIYHTSYAVRTVIGLTVSALLAIGVGAGYAQRIFAGYYGTTPPRFANPNGFQGSFTFCRVIATAFSRSCIGEVNDEGRMTVSGVVDDRPARLAFRIPEQCPFCFRDSNIKPGQTIRGRVVDLSWCCSACGHEWPVAPTEQERRMNGDRRDFAQPDRRRQQSA